MILLQLRPLLLICFMEVASSYKFRSVRFSHVHRKGNVLAHILAKQALCIDDFIAWIEENSYSI